ncbi:MAG TPA: hypothetical protein VFX70_05890 [Mycobacteriales bacterium]|nr:hypothetical protein [Mycobacteriales bacterium]
MRLRAAIAVGVAGGLLLAVGALLPVVSPTTPAGFTSGPLLFVLGLLPVGIAVVLATRGSAAAVSGVLIAAAVFVPGRALADAQLAIQASSTDRPEFAMPSSLVHLNAGIGLWLILAGHVLTLVAGVLAAGLGEASDPAGAASERRPGSYQGPVLLALGLGALAGVGLVAKPFTSDNPFLLARGALDLPPVALVGGLLIAVAVPLAATIAVTSADSAMAKGWLLGSGAVVLAVALPRLVSGLAVDGLGPTWGPYGAVLAAVALLGFGLVTDRTVTAGMETSAGDDSAEHADFTLPGQSRLHLATGVAGLLAAGAALVGADTSLFMAPSGLPQPTDVAGRLLIPAAALIGVCAIGMLVPRWASVIRPAIAVAWVAVLLAGTEAFDTALTATQIDGVRIGAGFWASALAMLAAITVGCCAGLAGGVERDDVDLTSLKRQPAVLIPGVAAALLAFGAFGLPVLKATGYTVPGLWSDFRFASWGLVFSLIAVVAAAVLAPICRPQRAAALLLGAAGVVAVRVLALPLDRSTAPNPVPGSGFVLAVVCLVALLVGAGLAMWLAGRRPVRVATRR